MRRNILITLTAMAVFLLLLFILRNITGKDNTAGIYLNGEKIGESTDYIKKDSMYFISFDKLTENNLLDGYLCKEENMIVLYKDFKKYQIKIDDNENMLINQDLIYLSIDYIKDKYIGEITAHAYNKFISYESAYNTYKTENNISLKDKDTINSSKSGIIKKGEIIKVFFSDNEWSRVLYKEKIGYVRSSQIIPLTAKLSDKTVKQKIKPEIVLSWDVITRVLKKFEPEDFPVPDGLNTISPTFYKLNENYEFDDYSNLEYFDYYRNNNIDIWPAFSNSFDPELTSEILGTLTCRNHIIDKIIFIAEKNNSKGINIDFENIYYKDKENFARFIKELYIKMKERNIILSVDITCISNSENWSMFYDRNVIGKYSDYVILMAYDERTSPEHGIGPISSLPWVDSNVSQLTDYMDKEKIILGIPFYTRLWETNLSDGKTTTKAFKLSTMEEYVQENNMTVTYDEKYGQNYAEKTKNGIMLQMWLEDEKSLENRINIAQKYKINGLAIWSNNYSINPMWQLIKSRY